MDSIFDGRTTGMRIEVGLPSTFPVLSFRFDVYKQSYCSLRRVE